MSIYVQVFYTKLVVNDNFNKNIVAQHLINTYIYNQLFPMCGPNS